MAYGIYPRRRWMATRSFEQNLITQKPLLNKKMWLGVNFGPYSYRYNQASLVYKLFCKMGRYIKWGIRTLNLKGKLRLFNNLNQILKRYSFLEIYGLYNYRVV